MTTTADRDFYDLYRNALARGQVVRWESQDAWLVVGHDAVAQALRTEGLVQTWVGFLRGALGENPEDGPFADLWRNMSKWFLSLDAEAHSRVRRQVSKLFSPRRTAEMAEDLDRICGDLIAEKAAAGSFDVLTDLATPFTASMIAALLGLEPSSSEVLQSWSDSLSQFIDHPSDQTAEGAQEVVRAMSRLVDEVLATGGEAKVLAALLEGEADGALTGDEVAATAVMLLFAGHHTTSHLIGSTVFTIWSDPDLVARLRSDRSAISPAIEEVLRLESPVVNLDRRASTDIEIAGQRIAAGERVIISIAGANHDPAMFPSADEFQSDRDPNRHLAFGIGAHFCLGASLARAETRVVVEHLLALEGLRIDDPAPKWRRSSLRGLEELRVSVPSA